MGGCTWVGGQDNRVLQEVQRLEAALKGGNLPSQVEVRGVEIAAGWQHTHLAHRMGITTPWTKVDRDTCSPKHACCLFVSSVRNNDTHTIRVH